jgi:MOSC domain-containing protein
MEVRHATYAELEAALPLLRAAPRERGVLEMIVRRPASNEREVVEAGELRAGEGLVGDRWTSASKNEPLTLTSSRLMGLLVQTRERWPLAGDQLYVDFDLSAENVPAGTRLSLGSAVIEVSAQAHTGCRKYRDRFGLDALRFISSPMGRELNLRGINARVLTGGAVRVGDAICALFD